MKKNIQIIVALSCVLASGCFFCYQLLAENPPVDQPQATRVETRQYTLVSDLTDTTDTAGVFRIRITAGQGFEIKPDNPLLLMVLNTSPTIRVASNRLGWPDATLREKHELELLGRYAKDAGVGGTITTKLKFAVCDENSCQLIFQNITFQIP